MANLFFLLSGEHESLPFAELEAVLEVEGFEHEVVERLDQVVRLRASLKCAGVLRRRSAFVRVCVKELLCCEADVSVIVRALRSVRLRGFLRAGESFAVRVRRVRECCLGVDGMVLEGRLGGLLCGAVPGARVDLGRPDKVFFGVLTGGRFVFGLRLAEVEAKPFVERRPRRRPFFHPSAMQAKLARCMVNLAGARLGDVLLDPFCGTGTSLVEGSFVGCRVLGLDVQRRMARGTLRNLAHFGVVPEGVVVGDVRCLPFVGVDCVVADPPYGISSSTLKRTTGQIVEELLSAVHGVLGRGRRVCFAAPKSLRVGRLGVALGYRHLESHFVYVHRSLTREVVVLERA